MKLSKIINQYNKDQRLKNITIDIRPGYSVCIISVYEENGNLKHILEAYFNVKVDIDIPDTDIPVGWDNIKKCSTLVTDRYYINLLYY